MANSSVQIPNAETVQAEIATNVVGGKQYQVINLADSGGNAVSPLTDAQLRATPLAIAGSQSDGAAATGEALVIAGVTAGGVVQVIETNASGHVNIADGGGSITVDGPLTDSQLRAAAVPVSAASLPLPTGAATEATLDAILDKLPTASADMPSGTTPALPIRQAPQQYWDWSFASSVTNGVDTTKGTLLVTGAGMTVNQTGGNLVITSGTTANSETVIRTLESWGGALTLAEATTLSQRIANNNFFIELVDVIGDGLAYNIVNTTTVDVTLTAHQFTAANVGQRIDICAITGAAGIPMEGVIASIPNANTIRFTVAGWPATGTGTCSLTGWNKIELNYTGTVATNVNFNTRRQGYQNTAIAATINTTASGHIASINASGGVASLSDMLTTSVGAWADRNTWRTNLPQPDITLFLQIRARNGTTAPASTTTWTVGMVRVEDYIAQQVELTGTRQQSSGNSLPMRLIGTGAVSLAALPALVAGVARAAFMASHGIWFDDSATNLTANATFTGTSRDLTVTATATAFANAATYAQELRVSAESDVTGTLWLEVSRDNTNWRRVKSVATTAVTGGGFYAEIVHRPSWRYARVGYTNGAGAQTRFSIGSFLMAA